MRARSPSLSLIVGLAACHASKPAASGGAPPPQPVAARPVPMAAALTLDDTRLYKERARDMRDEGVSPAPPIVVAHNRVRAEHCAPPLVWSDALAAEAEAWAQHLAASGCAFEHSRSEHGENLAAGTAGALDPDAVVAMWAREEDHYDWRRPGFGMKTGHFTQVVWKDTIAVGCAVVTCGSLDTWVCNYDPPGNVEGDFPLNVAARGCQ
ncbi:MAG: hypothetical protein IPL61_39705 [Myxococcales bacterium]|nr:hypothetical protein [Myxococcales bacterium]